MDDFPVLEGLDVPLGRYSLCTSRPNSHGHKLIQFCQNNNAYIGNGRLGKDRYIGKKTCKDSTLVDYFILSSSLIKHIKEFEVKDFDPMFSDIHCLLHASWMYMNV